MTTMILLMGEQPAANLLPARHFRPDKVVIVHSARTQAQARRLGNVLAGLHIEPVVVEPYRIDRIADEIRRHLNLGDTTPADLLFNLTGGTKPMSLAAYDVARSLGSRILYFQTEGSLSRIYPYVFDDPDHPRPEPEIDLPESISLTDYLSLYLDDYEAGQRSESLVARDSGAVFESAVAVALQEAGFEVLQNLYPKREGAVEIDLVFRLGNQIGIMEAKLKAGKRAVDQLVAVGSQRYLGTYVARFVVSTQAIDRNNLNLAEAHRVKTIVLDNFSAAHDSLVEVDKQTLISAVRERMAPRG